jgi:acetyl esterase/lipase
MTTVLTATNRSEFTPATHTSSRADMPSGSLASKALAAYLQHTVRPFLSVWARTAHLPWPMHVVDYAGKLVPQLKGTECRRVELSECGAEWVSADGVSQNNVVLYLHGGAFVCCGMNTHRRLVSRVSESVDAPVLSVDYRMMPRAPISHAVEDGVDGYRHLLALGYRPDQIFIAGDSAGGYLAFMVALALGTVNLPRPAGIFVMSPLTDMDPTRKIEHENASKCAVFPAGAVPALTLMADRVDAKIVVEGKRGPRISPVDADLAGLPPVLIQAGSTEMVLADAELMAIRLEEAGVECELQVWEDQVHVFQAADFLPEARRAMLEIGEFVRTHSAFDTTSSTA